MTTPSTDPETLRARAAEIARKIAAEQFASVAECLFGRAYSGTEQRVLTDGLRQAARVAIIQTSELAAKCVETEIVEIYDDSPDIDIECNNLVRRSATAIRAGEHLQGNPHD